jgi:hypothetical protein
MFLRVCERLTPSKSDQPVEPIQDLKNRYETFLTRVSNYFFSSFFDGANFSRRCIALECLDKMFKIFGAMPYLASAENAEILLKCLDDTYEKNKIVAISILGQFPISIARLDNPEVVRSIW